jgi:hypothetical protein
VLKVLKNEYNIIYKDPTGDLKRQNCVNKQKIVMNTTKQR